MRLVKFLMVVSDYLLPRWNLDFDISRIMDIASHCRANQSTGHLLLDASLEMFSICTKSSCRLHRARSEDKNFLFVFDIWNLRLILKGSWNHVQNCGECVRLCWTDFNGYFHFCRAPLMTCAFHGKTSSVNSTHLNDDSVNEEIKKAPPQQQRPIQR